MELSRRNKQELLWMCKHVCKHGHKYIEHPACYEKDVLPGEKIGFFDIECSNLDANFGIILSFAIKERGCRPYGEVITPRQLKSPDQDKELVMSCVARLQNFDRVIGFYSTRFDVPFVRSRAMVHEIPFPGYGEIRHTDLWFWCRNKMKLNSNRLQTVCDFLGIPAKQHKLDGLLWTRALAGDKASLEHIYIHNMEDVESTERVFEKLLPFHKMTNTCM